MPLNILLFRKGEGQLHNLPICTIPKMMYSFQLSKNEESKRKAYHATTNIYFHEPKTLQNLCAKNEIFGLIAINSHATGGIFLRKAVCNFYPNILDLPKS